MKAGWVVHGTPQLQALGPREVTGRKVPGTGGAPGGAPFQAEDKSHVHRRAYGDSAVEVGSPLSQGQDNLGASLREVIHTCCRE